MVSGVVGGQSIPGLEVLVTDDAGVRHVDVHLCVPPHLGLVTHHLATMITGVLSRALHRSAPKHAIQHTVEV